MLHENQPPQEDAKSIREQEEIAKSQQKSRRVFVFYIVALFCVALFIILASYVVQSNKQREFDSMGAELNKQVTLANGEREQLKEKIKSVEKKNKTLKADLKTAQSDLSKKDEELKAAQEQLEQSEADAEAMAMLLDLQRVYLAGSVNQSQSRILQMDSKFEHKVLVDEEQKPLTGDAAKLYADICAEMN